MNRFMSAFLALATALAIAPAALAGSLCPGTAWTGTSDANGNHVGTITGAGNTDCGSVTMTIPDDNNDSAGLFWGSSSWGNTGLTAGNIASFNTAASFTGAAGAQPYYIIDYHDSSNIFGGENSGDTIDLIENQLGNLSGGNMAFDPSTTELAVFDDNTGMYHVGGTNTRDGWLSLYPLLGSEPIYVGVEIGEGGSGVSASLKVTGADFTATPEPTSLLLFGTGLVSLAGILRRKLRV
jgi:hypothetical protein